MVNYTEKILYGLLLFILLFVGIGVGYLLSGSSSGIKNNTIADISSSGFPEIQNLNDTVTVSTKTVDIKVVYEDFYPLCNDSVRETKMYYGAVMDSVKEKEKEYQEKAGLVYDIISETDSTIVYSRKMKGNCPNHFMVVLEEGKINVYQILGENKKSLYMTMNNINVQNLREEMRNKITKGTYLNSKEELNKFIEDLES